ncbi:hypothetical protein VSU19_22060 [Verrucomicrobiales bacterium BCK34]|nr:hypothetical protein [Verrucomicrobiales bacterium BCK34]
MNFRTVLSHQPKINRVSKIVDNTCENGEAVGQGFTDDFQNGETQVEEECDSEIAADPGDVIAAD